MLRVFQRQFQHSAGRGDLLRVNAGLQVILKLCNAGFDLFMAGTALVCGHCIKNCILHRLW